MLPSNILKCFLALLKRTPCPSFPQLSFRIATETAEVVPPVLVASVELSEGSNTPGNRAALLDADFTLEFNAQDFSDETVPALLGEVESALNTLTVGALNAAADELGFPEHFYFFRWERTAFPAADPDGILRFTFSFKGRVQF